MWRDPRSLDEIEEATDYSDGFENKKDCERWYRMFGMRLERMFGRELKLVLR